jgi:hypothetical protein
MATKSTIDSRVIQDSISPDGARLLTYRVRFLKNLLAEFNTHRMFSRSWASSRAIPARKVREQIMSDPALPVYWGKNEAGMSASQELSGWRLKAAKTIWLLARWLIPPVPAHWLLQQLGLHKQLTNRLLENWMWAEGVVSFTEDAAENFFKLRCHSDTQPEFQRLAKSMRDNYWASTPTVVNWGEWHTPLVNPTHNVYSDCIQSSARCARSSYGRADEQSTVEMDIKTVTKLAGSDPKHLGPFEHVATPARGRHGNFTGWRQLRVSVEKTGIAGLDYLKP